LCLALGRPLNAIETRFVRKIASVFLRCRQVRHITCWDFNEMGLGWSGDSWNPLPIWPDFPAHEHEFWLYVANAAQEHRVAIPEFMGPVTDLTPIQERLRQWRRKREIDRWNNTLRDVPLHPLAKPATPAEGIELRLLVEAEALRLQCRRPSQAAFETLKQTQFRQLVQDEDNGFLHLTPEAELIWEYFAQRQYGGSPERLRYSDPEAPRVLGRLLRLLTLDNHVVDPEGRILARPAEPLRWQLTPAVDAGDDYRLHLVQADGSPPPSFLCILPGNPALYLTANALFRGPPTLDRVLDPAGETRIPAPALEQATGVNLLQKLDIALPPRLQERVRILPYQITVTCELRPISEGSKAEDCIVRVLAEASDGHQQIWTGYNWLHMDPPGRGSKARDQVILLYDSTALEAIPPLLSPLGLRPSEYGRGLTLRVSRKFPELFSTWLQTVPPNIRLELLGDLASLTQQDVSGRVKLDVSEVTIDWFDLRVVLDVSDTTLTPGELNLLLDAKGSYVRLTGKGWRRLRYDLSEEENERLAHLGLSPRELSAEPQRLHALQLAHEAARKFLPSHQIDQIQRRSAELKARVAPALPAAITAQLRPYQLEGFHFLAYLAANHFGGILADDMGLGKTLQTLAWLVWLREQEPGSDTVTRQRPSLAVCPKSVMDNWQAEATRFAPGLRVRLWPANELSVFHEQLASADLHVLNYSQLRSLGESLVPVRWLVLILDEGQYIKNPNSQTAQIARALAANYRLVLTGTPIENRLLDLWSLMAFAMPGVLGSRAQFARTYDAKDDPFARRRLASRVRPFLLRRTKAQVARDLPDRVEEDLFCELEGEQQALYRAELKRAQQLLLQIKTQKELAEQQFHFLTSLLRLRQICCDPRLVNPDSTAPSAKVEGLLEQLEPLMEEGQKVLVFSQFVQLLELLRPLIDQRKWPLFFLTGSTENRGELVQQFQSASGPGVFLISLKAGGFGLNLTAASYVVLFDPWWNPAVENQAIDRTHRIGQVNKVIAYRLLIKNSIEEKIRELQKQKKALVEDVLGEERFAQGLTLEDLRFLLAD
jgi:hypothetical protein